MSNEVVVRVNNVGKAFRRVHQKPMLLREAFLLLAGRTQRVDELWALRNVSFEVGRSEMIGFLGANGSGKSTMLAIVAGTSFPTEGSVSTKGRIATLLELGSGFHPDMTGEENVLVNAGILGIPPDDAASMMREIVEFAELEDAIDTPIRYYSSGMLARLGFAIAINVAPDILVVDEVLAVGDSKFQNKCMAEIHRLRAEGLTIVYASQSPMQIMTFCDRAIWLDGGEVKMEGTAREVGVAYARTMGANIGSGPEITGERAGA